MTEVISRNSSSIIMENSNDHNDDHDGSIDEIQLAEYQEMVEELGSFPVCVSSGGFIYNIYLCNKHSPKELITTIID